MEQANLLHSPDSIPHSTASNLHLKSVASSPPPPDSPRRKPPSPAELVNGHDRNTYQSDGDHDSDEISSSNGDDDSLLIQSDGDHRSSSSPLNNRRIPIGSDGAVSPQPDSSSIEDSSQNYSPIPVESDNGDVPAESDGGRDSEEVHVLKQEPSDSTGFQSNHNPPSDSNSSSNSSRRIQHESNGEEDHKEVQVSKQEIFSVDIPAIGEFIRIRSSSISSAISRRIASMKELRRSRTEITEFDVTGVKVVVEEKEKQDIGGRISFFSRSNCRDCRAVRVFLRERGVPFVEINMDVYPLREEELVQRTGVCTVPQIFFEDRLVGGLVALNSLRNSGLLEEVMGRRTTTAAAAAAAPAEPVYGCDDPGDDRRDEMAGVVAALRERVGVQDRVVRVRVVRSCFSGVDVVDVIVEHMGCSREKAIEVGKVLERKHFIHRVFGEDGGGFEEGTNLYRFLEHEPFTSKCLNFRSFTNDSEPKSASLIGRRLMKIMSAVLESFASDDRRHVDYAGICRSEEFRRYINLVEGLQRVDMEELGEEEKVAFFMNLYNAMAVHIIIRGGRLDGIIDRRSFVSDYMYLVGGHAYSLSTLKNGILRNNRRPPYSIIKPFGAHDRRLQFVIPSMNPLIHFGLCNGTRSGPVVQFFSHEGIEAELRSAAREFFQHGGIEVDLDKRTIHLSRIIKWFSVDFCREKEMAKWIVEYLDSTKAGLVTHLCVDGSPLNIAYQNYDWSLNV